MGSEGRAVIEKRYIFLVTPLLGDKIQSGNYCLDWTEMRVGVAKYIYKKKHLVFMCLVYQHFLSRIAAGIEHFPKCLMVFNV